MRSTTLSTLSACLLLALPASAAAATGEPPREPFFPRAGNVGYDATHYDVGLTYRPGGNLLVAEERVTATAGQRLSRFSLDLYGMRVTAVTVAGQRAEFRRGRGKLHVTPAEPVAKGESFDVVVRYRGQPRSVVDADGTREGWIPTDDGVLAVGEPLGTATWLACNNVPADKATFEIRVSVPAGLKAVSNGRLLEVTREGGRKRFRWGVSDPMSTYLAVVSIGRGRLVQEQIAGLPSWTLIDPRQERLARAELEALGEVIRFQSRVFGPYPFDSAGSIVDYAPELGYALETQTRPIYAFVPDLTTIVHETAHQWFGDSVGLQRWPNIWLNEGFATWAEWYYAERHGGPSAGANFRALYRVPASEARLWEPPSGHPGQPRHLFSPSTYLRGGMALEALRIKVGTKPMLKTLRRWVAEHRHQSATIKQFIALAEEVSGENLGPLFQRWLYQRGKP